MSSERKLKQQEAQDPGLGTSYRRSVKRVLNEDGSFNIKRIGTVSGIKDFYKYLVDLSAWKFAIFLVTGFISINLLFALGYMSIGMEHFHGISKSQHPFVTSFYFSTQTFTTVGYGAIAPKGNLTSLLASFEAFLGLIFFAIFTGLIYGRFSRPSTKIAFSHNVIITPHNDGMAMMFKMVNQRNSVLLNTKVQVMLSIVHEDYTRENLQRQYYDLPLQVEFVKYFPLTWTLVHQINEESPLWGMSVPQIRERLSELLIIVEAFDETYSQMVLQKHSYADHQWVGGVKFKRNFAADESGTIILNIDQLSDLEVLS